MTDGRIERTTPSTHDEVGAIRRASKTLRWQVVARRVIDGIQRGHLLPGHRVPSVREMSQLARVSISTVVQAYVQLEAQGHIESRERSGFFVRPRSEPPVPTAIELPTTRPTQVAAEVVQQIMQSLSRGVLPLSTATLSPSLLPAGSLRRIASRLLRHSHRQLLNYEIPPGNRVLRQQIARRLALTGARVSADDVLITTGGMEALNICLRTLCRPGDTVLVESPTYFGILQCLDHLGLRALEIPNSSATGIDPEQVRKAIRRVKVAAALLVPNFNNPTGSVTNDEAKRAIVGMLAEADIPLIEDDVYGELHFSGARPTPMKAFDEHDNVLTCGSISKTVAPGYRVGWVVSRRHCDALVQSKLSTSLASSTIEQWVIGEFMSNGFDRHLRKLRRILQQQVAAFSAAILAHFPAGTCVSRPSGGFVLWVELPSDIDCLQLMHRALQSGISISPGTIFSATGAYGNFMRVNCGVEWSPAVEKALRLLGKLAHALQTAR